MSARWGNRCGGNRAGWAGLLAVAGWLVGSSMTLAGGGPENVFLVVNSASWASQAVANQYIRLRRIPPDNVCYLDWHGGFEVTDLTTFRQQILGPALLKLQQRGLEDQVDYIVYSSDFPTAIAAKDEFLELQLPNELYPTASINSLTYLWKSVLAKSPATISLANNHYLRKTSIDAPLSVHGFRSWYGWGPGGRLLEAGGQHYYLSTVLAVTSGRGNSVGEAINSLRRSANADGTHPGGTIYYMRNSDVRSKVRDAGYPAAVAELKKLNVRAVIESGTIPSGRTDVQGMMAGTKQFDWSRSGSTILPGALCDYFTSLGGIMIEGTNQTPLSELLRYGAAGTCGAVVEPFTMPQKFATPYVQVYYASGCTLAESFYQSLSGPFQLLIVGDPLCRPWANIPRVSSGAVRPNATLRGTVEIRPTATFSTAGKKLPGGDPSDHVASYELYVDGRRIASAAPGDALALDSRRLADGFHELRIVAIAAGAIETQGRAVLRVNIDNRGRTIDFTAMPDSKDGPDDRKEAATKEPDKKEADKKTTSDRKSTPDRSAARWDETLVLAATAPGMAEIVFSHNGRVLGRVDRDEARLKINPRILGTGPVTLQAFGRAPAESVVSVRSQPIELNVEANRPLPAWTLPRGVTLARGMQLLLAGGKTVPIQETLTPTWLADAGVKPGEAVELDAVFDAGATEVYQFQLWHDGALKLSVDGRTLYDGKEGNDTGGKERSDSGKEATGPKTKPGIDREEFVPIALAAGLHRLKVTGQAGPQMRLRILFGGQGTLSLDGVRFRHTSR